MESTINLDVGDIKKDVYRHLSIIGKRLKSKDGSSQFQTATLSSAEDGEFDQHLSDSVARIAAEFTDSMSEFSITGSSVVMTVFNTRWNESMSAAFTRSVMSAIVACVTYEIIAVYAPDYSKKFADDTTASILDLKRHLYTALPPSAGGDLVKVHTGSVTLNNK